MRPSHRCWIALLASIAGCGLSGASWADSRTAGSDLVAASRAGHVDAAKALLEGGAKTEIRDRTGNTALILATRNGRAEIVSLLLEHGANPDLANRAGQTALITATDGERLEIVNELLAHGADVDHRDGYGRTALFEASRRGNGEIVTALLKKDASPHYQNRTGNTALIWAARKGYPEIAKPLLAHAADPNVKNNRGDDALHWAVMARYSDIAIDLLDANANPDAKNSDGHTALLIATAQGNAPVVRALLEHEASPNGSSAISSKPSSTSWTPLMLAASAGDAAVAALLLQHGANPNLKNQHGWTALDYAAQGGYRSLVDTLVDAGATSGENRPSGSLTGTGFFVDDNGHFVTREHVVWTCKRGVRLEGGAKLLTARLVATDSEKDLALLLVSDAPNLSPPGFAVSRAMRGAVAAVGYPVREPPDAGFTVLEGRITTPAAGWRARDDFDVATTNSPLTAPLTAGGPILDTGANVIGIASRWRPWRIDADMRLTFSESETTADKNGVLTAFLDAQEVAYSKSRAMQKVDEEQPALTETQFVRSVECIR